MKKIFAFYRIQLKKWFSNLPLPKKIQLIAISCLFLLMASSILITNLLLHKYNELLLDSVSASLSYTNDNFSKKLDDAYNLSYTILSDPTLQNQLARVRTASGSTEKATLYTQIKSRLHSYCQEHQQDFISYISLYTPQFSCHTSASKSHSISDAQLTDILSNAHDASGKAIWITDQTNGRDLLLAREIRQYNNLSLTPLGTLIISIDLDSMVNGCSMFSEYDSFFYRIMDQSNNLVYDSITLHSAERTSDLSLKYKTISKNYSIATYRGHWYLSVSGSLNQNDWSYNCLVSYDSIRNTMNFWRMIIVALLFFSCCLITIASQFIIRSQTRHFGFLVKKMQRFASSPDSLTGFSPDSQYNYENRKDEIGTLHQQFDHMASQIAALIESNYAKELLVKEAQLKALEMQINPHFLYNTLESINWRAKSAGASDISQMVEALGNLFRAVLSHNEENFTIAEELSLIDNYLTIQKCRFGSRLLYSVHMQPNLANVQIPKLSIQPLVENAVSHAMDSLMEECFINIIIQQNSSLLEILVQNTGSSFEDNLLNKLRDKTITPNGLGIGLLNIDKRLRLMYGTDCLFLYNENGMATASIRFPQTDITGE